MMIYSYEKFGLRRRYTNANLDGLKQAFGIDFKSLEGLVKSNSGDEILQHSRRSVDWGLELYCIELKLDGNILELYHQRGDKVLEVMLKDLLHDVAWGITPEENRLIEHAEVGVNFIAENLSGRLKDDILKSVIYFVKYHTPWKKAGADTLTLEFKAPYDGEKIDFLLTHPGSPLCNKAYEDLYLDSSRSIYKKE